MEKLATRGRPREFDVDEALGAALRVFWIKGYEGAALTDLTEAMGITRPSLYAAFGNKEALFKQALDLYEEVKLAYVGQALEAETAKGVAQNLLQGAIETMTDGECRGCMGVIASVICQSAEDTIRADLNRRTESSNRALVERMQKAIDDGDFPNPADAEAITLYLKAVLQGMSVQAQSGAEIQQLQQIAEATLAGWPSR